MDIDAACGCWQWDVCVCVHVQVAFLWNDTKVFLQTRSIYLAQQQHELSTSCNMKNNCDANHTKRKITSQFVLPLMVASFLLHHQHIDAIWTVATQFSVDLLSHCSYCTSHILLTSPATLWSATRLYKSGSESMPQTRAIHRKQPQF